MDYVFFIGLVCKNYIWRTEDTDELLSRFKQYIFRTADKPMPSKLKWNLSGWALNVYSWPHAHYRCDHLPHSQNPPVRVIKWKNVIKWKPINAMCLVAQNS